MTNSGSLSQPPRGERRPTLEDVAELSGYALRTTKKVMGGGNERVPEETRRRVLAAAEELGYRKNAFASALALARTRRVALVYSTITENYFPEVQEGFTRFAEEHVDYGFEVEFVTSKSGDVDQQIETLRAMGNDESITGVALHPLSATRLDAVIQELTDAGKVVVTFGADAPHSGRLAYIGPDAYRAGRIGGQILANYMNKTGTALVVSRGIEHMQTQERRRGFRDRFVEHYPLMTVVDLSIDGQSDSYVAISEAMDSLPVRGIFATSADSLTIGRLLRDRGVTHLPVVGFDTSPETAALMRSGYLKVLLEQAPADFSYRALRILFDYLYRQIVPTSVIHTDVAILTSECLPPE